MVHSNMGIKQILKNLTELFTLSASEIFRIGGSGWKGSSVVPIHFLYKTAVLAQLELVMNYTNRNNLSCDT